MKKTYDRGTEIIAVLAVLFGLALLFYWRNLSSGFVQDDWLWLFLARRDGISGNSLSVSAGQPFYRPVGGTIFGLIWTAFGTNPVPYHLASVVGLVATGFALWGVWKHLLPDSPRWSALLAPVLFVTWGSHSETICWIAAFPDLAAGLFGAFSLWAWLVFARRGSTWFLALGVLTTFLAIGSKESALPLAIVAPLLCWLECAKGEEWIRTPATPLRWALWTATFGPALTIAGFWGLRTMLIHRFVGGYPVNPFRNLLIHMVGERAFTHLINMFLPFGQEVAARFGQSTAIAFTLSALLAGLLWLIHGWKKSGKSGHEGPSLALIFLGLLSLLWAAALNFQMWWDLLEQILRRPLILLIDGLLWASLYWLARQVQRRLSAYAFSPVRRTGWLVSGLLVAGYLYFNVTQALDQLALLAWAITWVALLRPPTDDRHHVLRLAILVCSAAAIISIAPTHNLPIGLDGQQERYSYFGSLFSVLALSGLIFLIPRNWAKASLLSAVALTSACALWSGNTDWQRTGEIASDAAAIMRQALAQGKKVYVLSAPGTVNGAGLFTMGIDLMASPLLGKPDAFVGRAYVLLNATTSDRAVVSQVDPTLFRVKLARSSDSGATRSELRFMGLPRMFRLENGDVRLVHYRSGDRVLVIQPNGVFPIK